MNVKAADKSITINGVKDFNLIHIFECGQCFRWDKAEDGTYSGVAKGKAVRILSDGDCVTINNATEEDFNTIWKDYFDLHNDYSEIKLKLSSDPVMNTAIKSGEGIRILNQDLWECIVSFIISANNNIPRIKSIIKTFCEIFGEPLVFDDVTYYTFPDFKRLKNIKKEDLAPIRAGYRDKYIMDAIEKVNAGDIDFELIKTAPYEKAKAEIMKIKGIGSKVADCILLFGAGKRNAFPVDVWIKRVMQTFYGEEMGERDIREFAYEKFADLGGYAQQYLFYHMRENAN